MQTEAFVQFDVFQGAPQRRLSLPPPHSVDEKEKKVVAAKKIRVKIIKPDSAKKGKKGSESPSAAALGVDPNAVFGSLALKDRISPPPEKIVASP